MYFRWRKKRWSVWTHLTFLGNATMFFSYRFNLTRVRRSATRRHHFSLAITACWAQSIPWEGLLLVWSLFLRSTDQQIIFNLYNWPTRENTRKNTKKSHLEVWSCSISEMMPVQLVMWSPGSGLVWNVHCLLLIQRFFSGPEQVCVWDQSSWMWVWCKRSSGRNIKPKHTSRSHTHTTLCIVDHYHAGHLLGSNAPLEGRPDGGNKRSPLTLHIELTDWRHELKMKGCSGRGAGLQRKGNDTWWARTWQVAGEPIEKAKAHSLALQHVWRGSKHLNIISHYKVLQTQYHPVFILFVKAKKINIIEVVL